MDLRAPTWRNMTTQDEFGEQYFAAQIGDVNSPRVIAERDLTLKLMPPRSGDKILDVGCGKGSLGYILLKQQPDIEMVFSDVTTEAKKYLQGQTFVECSMADMPFPDNSFDKIYCMHVLAHFADGEQGIKEGFRVLKKGGKLMILTPNKYYVYLSWFMTAIKKTRSGKQLNTTQPCNGCTAKANCSGNSIHARGLQSIIRIFN